MKITPLFDRVLVKRQEQEEKTAGGILIPDTAKEKNYHAEVVSVGTGKVLEDGKRREPVVKVGDKVLLDKYSGSEVKVDGQECLIIREDDILGIIQ